jgi:hypothetical protein
VAKRKKRSIPSKLVVLGHDFHVVETDSIEELGLMDLGSSTIYLSTKQTDSQKESTLIHEILEAIDALLELGLTHTQICSLESSIYQIYQANKL